MPVNSQPRRRLVLLLRAGHIKRVAHLQRRGDRADLAIDAAAGKHLADGVAQQHLLSSSAMPPQLMSASGKLVFAA